jgi:hypothetical protein
VQEYRSRGVEDCLGGFCKHTSSALPGPVIYQGNGEERNGIEKGEMERNGKRRFG